MFDLIARLMNWLRPRPRATPPPHASASQSPGPDVGAEVDPDAVPAVPPPFHTLTRPREICPAATPPCGRDVPGGRSVDGTLVLAPCPRLRSIGDDLVVNGDLIIGGWHPGGGGGSAHTYEARRVPIVMLPRGLSVARSLELHHCFRLLALPDDLRVGGAIVLDDCDALASLPDPWRVRGSLTITGGQSLARLPGSLHIAGDFRLSGTRVTRLPDDLVVLGSLVVQNRSRVVEVPPTVRVGGDVVLRRCPIESFPAGLRVAASLRLIGCRRLARLPDDLVVPGKLDLTDCAALEALPRGLRVGHSLKLKGCSSLRELPDGLAVPRTLDLRGCTSLAHLPRGMRIGFDFRATPGPPSAAPWVTNVGFTPRQIFTPALRLADCPKLTELPDDLQLGGPVEVAGSGLRDLPPSLAQAPVLWRGVLVPSDVAFHPERIAPLDVLRQPNAELRRVMMERLGAEHVLAGAGADTRDADTDAGGPRRLVHVRALNHTYLFCRCPSTARQYLLRVPPGTPTCRHAAAWMAGFDHPDHYRPVLET